MCLSAHPQKSRRIFCRVTALLRSDSDAASLSSGAARNLTGATVCGVTAKEKLRERVEGLSEEEAAKALRLLDEREDPVVAAFRDAPVDDEPLTPEEEGALVEADRDIAAGRTISLEELKRELGDE